jgi:hypothetical protein
VFINGLWPLASSKPAVIGYSFGGGHGELQPAHRGQGRHAQFRPGPTLIVSGEKDHTVPPTLSRAARTRQQQNPNVTEW